MKETMRPPDEPVGIDRRSLLRRSAAVGGVVVWTTPLVQTIASPAFAAGSPLCDLKVEADNCTITYVESPDCCECVESYPNLSQAEALARCAREGRCTEDLVVCGEEEEDDDGDGDKSIKPEVPTVIPAGS